MTGEIATLYSLALTFGWGFIAFATGWLLTERITARLRSRRNINRRLRNIGGQS